jgi:hypothetical protein
MARQGIGTGSSANDGSGDNLRAAGGKINDNFTELYEYFGDGSTLSNGRWDVVSSGINTLSSVGIGTTNPRFTLEVGAVGASGTSLYVNGDARVTGILTVGSSSVTLNGSTNEIIVGTGITINGNTGIISATEVTIAGEKLTGAGVTSLVAGSNITLSGSTGQVTISSSGSGGTGAGGTWANYDTNTGVSTTKKVKIENDLEVTGVTTMSSAIVGTAVTIRNSGINITGVSTFVGNVDMPAAYDFAMGTSAVESGTFKMYNGSNRFFEIFGGSAASYIRNAGSNAGGILIQAEGGVTLSGNGTGTFSVYADDNGTAKLYSTGTQERLKTDPGGVIITGVCTATSFSGGGITTSRTNVSAATGSIGAGATSNLSITAYKSYGLLKVGISSAAWVRLYVDAASRTSDASRSYLADPAAGSGLIAEVRTETAGISTFLMTPGVIGWNNDVSVGSTVYAAVTNNESSAADITVTLSVVKMED